MIEIIHLANKIEYFDNVVDCMWKEWGTVHNFNYWHSLIKSSLNTETIPQIYICIKENKFIATFGLWRCELPARQDLCPWFGGLFVEKNYRGKRTGTELQKFAINKSKELGFKEIYLSTIINGYYEKTNWVYFDDAPDENGLIYKLYKRSTDW